MGAWGVEAAVCLSPRLRACSTRVSLSGARSELEAAVPPQPLRRRLTAQVPSTWHGEKVPSVAISGMEW